MWSTVTTVTIAVAVAISVANYGASIVVASSSYYAVATVAIEVTTEPIAVAINGMAYKA